MASGKSCYNISDNNFIFESDSNNSPWFFPYYFSCAFMQLADKFSDSGRFT